MYPLELEESVVEEEKEEEKEEEEESSKTNENKWLYVLYVTVLFLVVSMPVTYKFTNALLKGVCVLASKNGCPTICGILVHAVVFLLLLRLGDEFMPIYEGMLNDKEKARLDELNKKEKKKLKKGKKLKKSERKERRLLILKRDNIKAYNERMQNKKLNRAARNYIDDVLNDGNPATDIMLKNVCNEYNKRYQ